MNFSMPATIAEFASHFFTRYSEGMEPIALFAQQPAPSQPIALPGGRIVIPLLPFLVLGVYFIMWRRKRKPPRQRLKMRAKKKSS